MKKLSTLLMLFSISLLLKAQVLDPNFWIPNGPVYAIAYDANYVYLGGAFDSIQIAPLPVGHGTKLTSTTSFPDLSFPNINGSILTVVPDGNGGWYIGGYFTQVGIYQRNNLAHIKSDKTVDTNWNPNPNEGISAIAVSGGDIYVGGGFTHIGGQDRNYIAKLNNTTGAANASWNSGANNIVMSITINDNDIYVGGDFTGIGGQSRNRIAKINTITGTVDADWNPDVSGTEHCRVNSIIISEGDIYIGGDFKLVGGQSRNYIAKVNNNDGAADVNWNPGANDQVSVITINGNDLYVGGQFTSIGGQNRNYIARLNNTTGVADAYWNPDANDMISAIAISGSDIYIGGGFKSIGGKSQKYIAKLNNTNGVADAKWNPYLNDGVNSIAINDNDVYVGGDFTSTVGGESRNGIARLYSSTGALDANWNPDIEPWYDPFIGIIAISGSNIYVAGDFKGYVAKLDYMTGIIDTKWIPSFNKGVWSLAASSNDIYVGGYFTNPGNFVAKINGTNGLTDAIWNPKIYDASNDGAIASISISGNDIYVGGGFTSAGDQSRINIAKLNNTDGTADPNWNPKANHVVDLIVANGGEIFVAGNFWNIGGESRNYIAKLNNTTGAADALWNPNANDDVYAIAPNGNDIYVGGAFTNIGGQNRNYLAKLNNTSGAADASWNLGADKTVHSIVINGSNLYVGGEFTSIGNNAGRSYFAKFSIPQTPVNSTPVLNTSSLKIYPNPFINMVTIDLEESIEKSVMVLIYNIQGGLVMQKELDKSKPVIDLSRLISGSYLVKVVNGEKIHFEVLLKK